MVSLGSFKKWKILLFAVVATGGATLVERTLASSSSSSVNDEIEAVASPLRRQIETLQEQVEQYEMKHETLEAATDTFRIKAKSLKTKLEEERQRYDRVLSEKRNLEDQIEEKVRAEVERSTKAYEAFKTEQSKKQRDLQTKIVTLETEISDLAKERSKVEDDLKLKLKDEKQRYQTFLGESAGEKKELQAEITTLSSRLKDAEAKAASLEQTLNSTLAEEKQKEETHQKELRMRSAEATRWQARIKQLNAENKELSTVVQLKDTELLAAKAKLTKNQDAIKSWQEQLEKKDDLISQYVFTLESQEEENIVLKQTISDLNKQLDESRTIDAGLRKKMEQLSISLVEAELELKEAKTGLENATKLSSHLSASNEEIVTLKQQISFLQDELEESELNSRKCASAIEGMLIDYEELSKDMNTTKHQLDSSEVLYSKCKTDLSVLQSQTERLQAEIDRITAKAGNNSDQTELYQAQLKELKERYTEMEAVALQNKKDLEESRSQNLQLSSELSSHLKELDQTSIELEKLQAKYNYLSTASKTSKARVAELEESNGKLASELVTIKKALVESVIRATTDAESELEEESKEEEFVSEAEMTEATTAAATVTELDIEETDECLLPDRIAEEAESVEAPIKKESDTEPTTKESSSTLSSTKKASDSDSSWWKYIRAFFKWLDRSLYYILRAIIHIPRYLFTGMPNAIVPATSVVSEIPTPTAPPKSNYKSIGGLFRTLHLTLVSWLESSASAVSKFVNGGGWIGCAATFAHGYSHLLVLLGEIVAALLCIDYVISSMVRPTKRLKPVKIQPMKVPTTADSSLLRKAKTSWA